MQQNQWEKAQQNHYFQVKFYVNSEKCTQQNNDQDNKFWEKYHEHKENYMYTFVVLPK